MSAFSQSGRGTVVAKAFNQLMQRGPYLRWRVVALVTLKDVEVHIQRRENHVGRVHRVIDIGLAGCNRLPQQVIDDAVEPAVNRSAATRPAATSRGPAF